MRISALIIGLLGSLAWLTLAFLSLVLDPFRIAGREVPDTFWINAGFGFAAMLGAGLSMGYPRLGATLLIGVPAFRFLFLTARVDAPIILLMAPLVIAGVLALLGSRKGIDKPI